MIIAIRLINGKETLVNTDHIVNVTHKEDDKEINIVHLTNDSHYQTRMSFSEFQYLLNQPIPER